MRRLCIALVCCAPALFLLHLCSLPPAQPVPLKPPDPPLKPTTRRLVEAPDPLTPLFEAIALVETGGEPDPDSAVGDNGRSLGRYQIGRLYWLDSGVPGDWSDVRDPAYARRAMLAYWRRWCPHALSIHDFHTLARYHNGGPTLNVSPSAHRYADRVLLHME